MKNPLSTGQGLPRKGTRHGWLDQGALDRAEGGVVLGPYQVRKAVALVHGHAGQGPDAVERALDEPARQHGHAVPKVDHGTLVPRGDVDPVGFPWRDGGCCVREHLQPGRVGEDKGEAAQVRVRRLRRGEGHPPGAVVLEETQQVGGGAARVVEALEPLSLGQGQGLGEGREDGLRGGTQALEQGAERLRVGRDTGGMGEGLRCDIQEAVPG